MTELGKKEGEMGSLPTNKATTGRVNPKGISILYLGDSLDISLKEIRAGLYDYVSVGTFVLLKDLNIFYLTQISMKLSLLRD